jgi:hypothetical protein
LGTEDAQYIIPDHGVAAWLWPNTAICIYGDDFNKL